MTTKKKMQKGGAMSDIKSGAKQIAKGVNKGVDNSKKVVKAAIKTTPQYQAYKTVGKAAKRLDDKLEKRYPNYTGKGTVYDGVKKGVKSLFGYETGGVVNSNTSVKKQTVAGSKGVKSGVNSKVTASKIAKGRAGGTSTSPKTAVPKAK